MPTGMLTKKIHSQERRSVRIPPMRTPAAAPKPPTAPQAPSAMLRSLPSLNVVVRIESAEGVTVGGAQPLERPGRDQRLVTPREPAEQRADREDDEAAHEDASAPEDVGEPAAEQEEPSEDQGVGADHPLQVLLRKAEIQLDRRQGDVHDRTSSTTMNCTAQSSASANHFVLSDPDHGDSPSSSSVSSRRRTGGAGRRQPCPRSGDGYALTSATRRCRKRRSGSACASSSARSYSVRASSARPSRRSRSARVEWKYW